MDATTEKNYLRKCTRKWFCVMMSDTNKCANFAFVSIFSFEESEIRSFSSMEQGVCVLCTELIESQKYIIYSSQQLLQAIIVIAPYIYLCVFIHCELVDKDHSFCGWQKLTYKTIVKTVSSPISLVRITARRMECLHQCNRVSSMIFAPLYTATLCKSVCVCMFMSWARKNPTTEMEFHWKLNDTTRNAI